MRALRDLLRALRRLIWDLRGADLFALAGVVLRAVIEEGALGFDLDHRERLQLVVPDDRDGELAPHEALLDQHPRVRTRRFVAECQLDRGPELALVFDDGGAGARAAQPAASRRACSRCSAVIDGLCSMNASGSRSTTS